MCEYDFDWYYVDAFWAEQKASHSICDCSRVPEPGELVYHIIGEEHTGRPCPVMKRSVEYSEAPADPEHDCDACEYGYAIDWHRDSICQHCCEAARTLDVWCQGHFAWGNIAGQLQHHYSEDEIYRSPALRALYRLANNGWCFLATDSPAGIDHISWLADQAIAAVPTKTGA